MKRPVILLLATLAWMGCSEDSDTKTSPAGCGNGVLDSGELCDGTLFASGARVCPASYSLVSGKTVNDIKCNTACALAIDGVCEPSALCGNGKLDGDEPCDGVLFAAGARECPSGQSLVSGKSENDITCQGCRVVTSGVCEVKAVCGNGVVDEGEACDGKAFGEGTRECPDGESFLEGKSENDITCQGCRVVTSGVCAPSAKCGNSALDDGEVCDGDKFAENARQCPEGQVLAEGKTSADITCSASCAVVTSGACVDASTDPKCGDGRLDAGELCDGTQFADGVRVCPEGKIFAEGKTSADITCSDACDVVTSGACEASELEWRISDDCAGKNTCRVTYKCENHACVIDHRYAACTSSEQCTSSDAPYCDTASGCCMACTDDAQCGAGKKCHTDGRCIDECATNADCTNKSKPLCQAGACVAAECLSAADCTCGGEQKAVCDNYQCTCNDACVDSMATGLYWCQLMPPVAVTFDDSLSEATLRVDYRIGSDVNESSMKAQLVYGYESGTFDQTTWKSIDAVQDAAKDAFSAKLSKSAVASTGQTSAYYTFRICTENCDSASAVWKYCKSNTQKAESNPAEYNCSLSPYIVSDTERGNAHNTGLAQISSGDASKIIVSYTFDDPDSSIKSVNADTAIKPDAGTNATFATLSGSGKNNMCVSGGCFVNGTTTSALNLQGWKSTYDVSGASVTLKGMALGSSNALSMALWRNADGSPKNVKVLYSLDGTNFTIVEDVALSTNSKDLKKFLVHTVELPSAVNGKTGVSVRLVPYGGNGALRLDDIVIREK